MKLSEVIETCIQKIYQKLKMKSQKLKEGIRL